MEKTHKGENGRMFEIERAGVVTLYDVWGARLKVVGLYGPADGGFAKRVNSESSRKDNEQMERTNGCRRRL